MFKINMITVEFEQLLVIRNNIKIMIAFLSEFQICTTH